MFDLHPNHPLAFQAAIQNLASHGRSGEAVLLADKARRAHPENEQFESFYHYGLALLGLFEDAIKDGATDVKMFAAVAMEDFETAENILNEQLASEAADRYYGWGRWLYSIYQGEGSQDRLQNMVDLSLNKFAEDEIPWESQCRLYLIHDLRAVGRSEQTESMMDECRKQFEERLKVKYLCPCTLGAVVQYTILDGRMDKAVERADNWLSQGDSDITFHIDPIYSQLKNRPEYDDFLTRNAAQIQRQREIFLAGQEPSDKPVGSSF
jgi:tetratricopeptide (TPR) repeat protein